MPEGDTTTTTTTTTAPVWHAGIEAETVGFWQNKGYPVDDPKALATKLTEQYRSLEKHIGAPADRLIKLPEKADDTAGWNGVYERLGVPKDAKDYDLTGIKHADGRDVDAALTDALRAALHGSRVAKDRASDVVKTVVKTLDDRASADKTVNQSKIEAEQAELKKNWGQNYDFNHLKAMEGARKLGITPEAVKALENQIGFAGVMEAMRKIGSGTSEDAFHEGGGGARTITTREGAMAKKAELMADPAWGKRYTSGDVQAKREMDALNMQIDGEAA